MPEKILITAALLYANSSMHFGHLAGAYLPADCYARFQRMAGNDVLFISGSDEYGMAITLSAELAGRTPRQHVDLFHAINRELFSEMAISFDYYGRTTWPGHVAFTHTYFRDLYDAGHIAAKTTEQLYSEEEQRFLADRYVVGTCPKCSYDRARGDECSSCGASYEALALISPRSKLTGYPLVRRSTKHWFILLEQFKESLQKWLGTKDWKPNVVNFIKGYIDDLHPRAITRDMTWGVPIPLPDTEGKVLYVWFDAPIGYISATAQWAEEQGNPDRWRHYWHDSATKLVQFIGKDNIPFHAAIFPAMTMGQKQPYKLVDELPANEFYNLEGKKFSKSDGHYIDLADFLQRYQADQLRYTLASNAPESADSEFTWKDFLQRCNGELVGKYGNLLNRVTTFAHQHTKGEVPAIEVQSDEDRTFVAEIHALAAEVAASYGAFRLRRASQLWMEIAQKGNIYFNAKRPWLAAKEGRGADVATTIALCLEGLKVLAITSYPVMPTTAQKMWAALGMKTQIAEQLWETALSQPLPAGQKLPPPALLFQKIDEAQIVDEIAKLYGEAGESVPSPEAEQAAKHAAGTEAPPPTITIEQFRQLQLRVAQVLSVESIRNSDKLFKVTVDDGERRRTIVSGIAQHYTAQELIGKRIVIVANLQPTKLMGVESEGMLLAAQWDENFELLALSSAVPGANVK